MSEDELRELVEALAESHFELDDDATAVLTDEEVDQLEPCMSGEVQDAVNRG